MKAMIVHNVGKGQVTIKSNARGAVSITVPRGENHMFSSFEDYLTYQSNVSRLVAAQVLRLEEVKMVEKQTEYERPTLVDYDKEPERDVIVVRDVDTSAPTEEVSAKSKDELKVELQAAQDAYRAEKDKVLREEIKDKILSIKAQIKKL